MNYYLFFFFFVQALQHDIIFVQKKQICSSVNVINREWRLKLRSNKTFDYTVSEFSTLKFKQGIKNDTLNFSGLWELNNDTVVLHSKSLSDFCKTTVQYVRKGNDLFSMGARIDSIGNYQITNLNAVSSHSKQRK